MLKVLSRFTNSKRMFSGREIEWDASNLIWSWEKNAVYKGKYKDTGEVVAVKQIPYDSSKGKFEGIHPNLIREVTILRRLSPHIYIVQFHNTFCVNDNKRPVWNIVFEYLSCSLKQLIKQKLDSSNVMRLIYQILSGVAHCHSHSVIHRNLNSETILFEEKSRRIKIAGFGLSRSCSVPFGVEEKFLKSYSPGVEDADISYQPPEFLLLSENYSLSSDMWSVGCIFGKSLLIHIYIYCFFLNFSNQLIYYEISVMQLRWQEGMFCLKQILLV